MIDNNEILAIAKKKKKNAFFKPGKLSYTRRSIEGEFIFESMYDLLEFDEIQYWKTRSNFYGYRKRRLPDRRDEGLVVMLDYRKEYHGCVEWYTIGYIFGDYIDLDFWHPSRAIHKTDCWIRKYEGIKNDISYRDEDTKLEMLKECGWKNDTIKNAHKYCDCGLTDILQKNGIYE